MSRQRPRSIRSCGFSLSSLSSLLGRGLVLPAVVLALGGCGEAEERKPPTKADPCAERVEPPEAVPWFDGAGAFGIRDKASDFTVETLDGPFHFAKSWTGLDSHLFFVKVEIQQVLDAWNSNALKLKRFLEESPENVHYFFLSTAKDREADVREMKERMESALAALDPTLAEHWKQRLHYVTDDPRALGGSLGGFQALHGGIWFGIDRFQRWREVGSLYDFNTGKYELRFLAKEAEGFNYEKALDDRLGGFCGTEVTVFDGTKHAGGWEAGFSTTVEVELPSAEEMSRFDSMALYLYTACPGHKQGRDEGCNEWDYAHHLMLCDEGSSTECNVEFLRYVTSYGREGEWLTDVSPLLPLLKNGGKRAFQYKGANGYTLHGRLLLWNEGKSHRPVEARYLWGEGAVEVPFDTSYNDGRHEAVSFEVKDLPSTRVELFASITGHGFGSTLENCAEFCNHQHEFNLNGTEFTRDHAGDLGKYGCFDKVAEGVVPNQWGSWPFGRAGWCPGQDVKPWITDVSDALVSGQNTLTYRGLFRGDDYVPRPGGGGDYQPHVRVASWLVTYEPQNR